MWAVVRKILPALLSCSQTFARRGCAFQDPEMKTKSSIFFLLLLFIGATQATIAMQENLDQIATEVS